MAPFPNVLAQVMPAFIPHVEAAAIQYTYRMYAMASAVTTVYAPELGMNIRKVSEYLQHQRAVDLQENTAIPTSAIVRARKTEVSPIEVGHAYEISDRRMMTDLEDIVADTVRALGAGVGDRIEADLIKAGMDNLAGGTMGSSSTLFTHDLMVEAQFEMTHRAEPNEPLYCVVHPLQVKNVMKDLIRYSGSNAGVNLGFRERAINSWTVPGFDNAVYIQSSFIPRRVIHKLSVYGTGGTFRLAIKDGRTAGVDLTAAITVSATPATTVTNVKNALDALTFAGNSAWTVAGSANNDITITPPASLYLDKESELRVAIDWDNPTVSHVKSAYDLVTTLTGAPLDTNGTQLGVKLFEKSASAKAQVFYRDALIYDVRQTPSAYFDVLNDNRTGRWSLHTKYAADGWRVERGMFIETAANSAFATG
jgi:hypothetical protein